MSYEKIRTHEHGDVITYNTEIIIYKRMTKKKKVTIVKVPHRDKRYWVVGPIIGV